MVVDERTVTELAAPFGPIAEANDGERKDAALRALDGPADFNEVLATAVVVVPVDADF
jgi:hypothetical protein